MHCHHTRVSSTTKKILTLKTLKQKMDAVTCKIAVIDDWSKLAHDCADWSLLQPKCEIDFYYDNITDLQENIDRLKPYHIIVCNRNRTILKQPLLSQLPNLKLIASTGPGNHVIDVSYANKMGITVYIIGTLNNA